MARLLATALDGLADDPPLPQDTQVMAGTARPRSPSGSGQGAPAMAVRIWTVRQFEDRKALMLRLKLGWHKAC